MIRLTLVLTAALVTAPLAPAWAQRAAHSGEQADVTADALAIRNVRVDRGDGDPASEGPLCDLEPMETVAAFGSDNDGTISGVVTPGQQSLDVIRPCIADRELIASEFLTALSSAMAYGLPAPVDQDRWICIHSEGNGP